MAFCNKCGYGGETLIFRGPWKEICPQCGNKSEGSKLFYSDESAMNRGVKSRIAHQKKSKYSPSATEDSAEEIFEYASSKEGINKI